MRNELRVKRVYLSPEADDGYRILIDRLWPRGISREKAMIDEWNKDVTPSTELRKWFRHKDENYAVFAKLYRAELDECPEATGFVDHVVTLLESQNVTLLYGARSETCNHALILRDWVMNRQ